MKYLYKTPIKMPRGTHYGSDYWIVYSKKVFRKVHLYSMLEYANFLVLEMNPKVEYFCEQPLKITCDNDMKQHSIFDFWVYFIDGTSEFQEVKYSNELYGDDTNALRTQKQIELQTNWCKKENQLYRIITEKDLYKSEYYIGNLSQLYSFVSRNSEPIDIKMIAELQSFLSNGSKTISEIEKEKIFSNNSEILNLAKLYYKGHIDIDVINRPLDGKTEIQLCARENTIF